MADPRPGGLSCAEALDLAPAFVLGALTDAEMASVRAHLAECQEAHAEFAELGSVMPALLVAVPVVEAPAGLGDRIMATARAQQAEAERKILPAPRPAAEIKLASTRRLRWSRLGWAALAAAAVLVIVVLGANYVQQRNQIEQLTAYRDAVAGVIDRAAAGGPVAVLVNPQAVAGSASPSGLAAVGSDGSVAVAMRDLTPTTGAQVYELWMVGSDNVPLALGSFTVTVSGSGGTVTAATPVTAGVTLALTQEPHAGMTAPTLPIVAAGPVEQRSGS
jgi:Anti-sigma-K factor rskA, C-terminal/Putative zinc-finger